MCLQGCVDVAGCLCPCPLSSSTFTPYIYISTRWRYSRLRAHIQYAVFMWMCKCMHHATSALKRIESDFRAICHSQIPFAAAAASAATATDDIKYFVGCMNYESACKRKCLCVRLSGWVLVLYPNRFMLARPGKFPYLVCSAAKVLRWKDTFLPLILCAPPSLFWIFIRGFEWKSDWQGSRNSARAKAREVARERNQMRRDHKKNIFLIYDSNDKCVSMG